LFATGFYDRVHISPFSSNRVFIIRTASGRDMHGSASAPDEARDSSSKLRI
jgi:hypothetical protein